MYHPYQWAIAEMGEDKSFHKYFALFDVHVISNSGKGMKFLTGFGAKITNMLVKS